MTSLRTLGTSYLITALFALGACTATDDALVFEDTSGQTQTTPTSVEQTTPTVETATATPEVPPTTVAVSTPQTLSGPAQIYFAPIVGAPVDKVTTLSQRLSAASGEKGIQLQPARTQTTTNEIRGYFSAISTGSQTTVTHVWDVFSPSGDRVHRIQAQETVPGNASDPWSIVPSATMEQIANKVLDQYIAWRASLG